MSAGGEHLKDEGTPRQVVLAGGIAGLVSRFCIAPLDVVKIRLQLQIHSLSDPTSHHNIQGPIYKGTFSTLKSILKHEGITVPPPPPPQSLFLPNPTQPKLTFFSNEKALWKGNIPAELMYITYGATQFTTYRTVTHLLQTHSPRPLPPPLESFLAGATAGGLATATTYPLDLLRTRFAAAGPDRIYSSLATSVRDIIQHEGARGLFRGCSAAIAQIVPYMGLFFATYESLRPIVGSGGWGGSGDAVAGVVASVLAKTGVFPLDLVRKRLQVQGPTRGLYVHRNIPEYRGVGATIAVIVRTQGVRGLYRGLVVSLVKAAPASAVTMWTYEMALKQLREMGIADT
ncbi:mitochondrial thiamine pyrophosphate carrier 1 [Aspergillus campestris IBT 28561]|uniref:Mitochondrial thiamine pyrophosphate carrier 1 n=1 Tax=Aspergillus campestris (strain IBT 28561) TaxID=1392248 RepID=A0A2I1DBB6_ASPC2|nr:mitochondrial thiamine pyrophosphate carrier 1 [Aspergillus campestris IBT 28561]PKY07150.1 mitochondrial thiamine pyrophosphate carrier 1 [Aspergillus campestris IBT 28561]